MKSVKLSVCRAAQRRGDKADFMLVAKQLRGLLTDFEGKLQEAGLSDTEKLWMQFSLTQAYMQLGQCYDGLGNSKKVFQVHILHLHALPLAQGCYCPNLRPEQHLFQWHKSCQMQFAACLSVLAGFIS